MTYHSLEVTGGRGGNHTHETTRTVSGFNLMLRETFENFSNGVDGRLGGRGSSVNQGKSSVRILSEVERMETAGGEHEFQEPGLGVDLKDAPTVVTIIGDVMFLAKIK